MAKTVKVGKDGTPKTLSQIAEKQGVTLQALLSANPNIKNANKIRVGQSIKIPDTKKMPGAKGGPYGRVSKTEMNLMRSDGKAYTKGVRAKMKAGAETTPTPKKAAATKAAKDTSAQAMEKARRRRAAEKKPSMALPKPKPKTEIAKKKRVADRLAALAKKSKDKKDSTKSTSTATASQKASGGRNVARNKTKKDTLDKIIAAAKTSRRKGRKRNA